MAKLTRIKALHAYAKTDVVKSARPEELFILIKRSDVIGKAPDGVNILLKGSADVSDDIRKEDLDASGYGDDSADDMTSDAAPGLSPEEAKEHAGNLMKARGGIMKAAGLGEEDMAGNEGGEQRDPEQTAGETDDAFKARKAAFHKAKGSTVGGTVAKLEAKIAEFPSLIEAAISKALSGATAATQARPGTVVEKNAQGTEGGGAKDERTKDLEKLESLKVEKRAILDKIESKIALTDQENIRKGKVSQEILTLGTKLGVST